MSVEAVKECFDKAQPHLHVWQEPILFDDIETPPIPVSLLPPSIGNFAAALAEETETPVEMAIACVLGVVSTALTGKVVVSPKARWREPVNTYWFIELLPANLKSHVLKACTRPLKKWEIEENAKLQPEITKAASQRKSQEKHIEKLRSDATRNGDDKQRAKLFEEVAALEAALEEPKVPILLYANNLTPESLENHTYEQGGRFAVISDEGGVLETLTGIYSGGRANVDLMLKGIDGGDVRIRRISRQINMNPYLTLILCVQPKIREKMSSNPALQGNGTLERFLYVIPKSKIGYRTLNTLPMTDEIQANYDKVITSLLSLDMPCDADSKKTPYILTLSEGAYSDFQDFRLWLEPQLKPSGELSACNGWAGKAAGYALRIAGLLHMVEYGISSHQVSPETMRNALWITYYLTMHAKAAYRLIGLDEKVRLAKLVFDWVVSSGRAQFNRTELTKAMRHHMKSSQLDVAVKELAERHVMREEVLQSAGTKPITLYTMNPVIFGQQAG